MAERWSSYSFDFIRPWSHRVPGGDQIWTAGPPRHTDCKPLTVWLHVHFNASVAGRCCVITDYKATRTTNSTHVVFPYAPLSVRLSFSKDTKNRIFRRRVKKTKSFIFDFHVNNCTNLSPQKSRCRLEWKKNEERKIDRGRGISVNLSFPYRSSKRLILAWFAEAARNGRDARETLFTVGGRQWRRHTSLPA